MKYCGYCDYLAEDRGIYVEASTKEVVIKKMKKAISAIYDCTEDDISLYNVADELGNPDGVFDFVCGWSDKPIILG